MNKCIKLFVLGIVLNFFNFELSFSQETKFQFRGVPQDAKTTEAILKINPDLLISISDAKKLSNDLVATNVFLKKISKTIKPSEEYALRGNASNIYSKYVQSVFLIYNKNSKMIGAGSLIDNDGYIITNLHVVEGAKFVEVIQKPEGNKQLNDAPRYSGEIILINEKNDLALIKVTGLPKNISIVPLGYLKDVNVGEEVHAIGHPQGLFWSYTKGVVSQIRNNYKWTSDKSKKGNYQATVIQTQTPISQGNSGGPLFNNAGKLVGVNTMIFGQGQNLNFSVAVDEVQELIKNKSQFSKKTNTNISSDQKSKNPISQKFPDAKEGSSKKDGIIDIWYLKNKETGKYDRALVDLKRRGLIDGLLVDANGKGKWTHLYLDEEKVGYWTHVVIFDGNGKTEYVGTLNRNGTINNLEKVS
jgi:S1-C subfamily serine protease